MPITTNGLVHTKLPSFFSVIMASTSVSEECTALFHQQFRQLLDSLNVVQSFSKKGYPFGNSCCQCFFKYLKKEETSRKTYHTLQGLQLSVFEYIEGFYFSKRPHVTLSMLTLNQAESLYWQQPRQPLLDKFLLKACPVT